MEYIDKHKLRALLILSSFPVVGMNFRHISKILNSLQDRELEIKKELTEEQDETIFRTIEKFSGIEMAERCMPNIRGVINSYLSKGT